MTTHSSVLLRESHRLKSLAGHSPWSCKELDATEATCLRAHLPHNIFDGEVLPSVSVIYFS